MTDKEINNNINNEETSTPEEKAVCDINNPFSAKDEKEQQLEQNIENELDKLKSQYVRLAADFDNYRKRITQEKEALVKYGAEDTLKKLLPVLDTFDRAQKSIETMDDPEKIKESFNVLYKQFIDALEKVGLQKIETNGKEFDPNFHEAVMQTPTNDHPDHAIIAELQSGYQLSEKVLRPALVNVAVNQ